MDLSPGTLISPVRAPVRAEPRVPTVTEVEDEGANGMLAKGMVADDVVSNDYGAGSVIRRSSTRRRWYHTGRRRG